MPKRKPTSVTLAGRRATRDAVTPGYEDATPERLARAAVEGAPTLEAGRRRIADPFDVLRSRGTLDRADPAANELLWQAGDRFRGHWYRGMLNGLSALDTSRPSVDGGAGPGGVTPTEAALRHRDQYRRAVDAIGPRLLPYVAGVVIEAQAIEALRPLVADTGHARTADALALERLRQGLHRLCEVWGMRTVTRAGRFRAWRGEPEEGAAGGEPNGY